MRGGRLGRRRTASGLQHDDWLAQGHSARRRQKGARVADRLHIDNDALGLRIVPEVIDQVTPGHVQHRASGNEGAEAQPPLQTPVQDGGTQRATLTEEGHVTGQCHTGGEARVEPGRWAEHAEAVRSDDAHATASGLRQHLLLQGHTACADLAKTGREDDSARDTGIGALGDEVRHGCGGYGDNGEVNRSGQCPKRWVGGQAKHVGPTRIDRIDRPGEGRTGHVCNERPTNTAHGFRGADDRHRPGREDGVQGPAVEHRRQPGAIYTPGRGNRGGNGHFSAPSS